MELKTLNYFLCIPSYDLVFLGQVFPNCLYAPNTLNLCYSSLRWSWSLSDTSLNVKYGIKGFEIIFVSTHPHDLGYLIPVSLNQPNNPNTLELATPLPELSLDLKCKIKNLRKLEKTWFFRKWAKKARKSKILKHLGRII